MGATASTYLMGYLGAALLVLGSVTAGFLVFTDRESAPRKLWSQYEARLEAEVRFQLWKTTGAYIARVQLLVVLALFVVCFFMGEPLLWLTMPVAVFGPWLGTPLDAAILNMSARLKSRLVSSSLATILVGRQTGGDLPAILEQSAATLREMQRLEGVVRTKTAEGRMQAFVLGAIPFVLLAVLHQMDPTYLVPLFETTTGNVVIIFAVILWFSAIIMARRILTVDI
jgi:Flp pilus assembly protein TadB